MKRDASWLREGSFGLMTHFMIHTAPRCGEKITDWNRMVDGFDVERYADDIAGTGASWTIFLFSQMAYYAAPNERLEALLPGHCARRDLMGELMRAFRARGVRFIGYIPAQMDQQPDPAVREAFGWHLSPSKAEFHRRYEPVLAEWGERYGGLLDGWWIDGCYDSRVWGHMPTHDWNNERFHESWFDALRAGNPQRLVAMNPGPHQPLPVHPDEDYSAGEAFELIDPFPLPQGIQRHVLLCMDTTDWRHTVTGEADPPRFPDEALAGFIRRQKAAGGAVTLNLAIYQDSTLSEASLAQIRRVLGHA